MRAGTRRLSAHEKAEIEAPSDRSDPDRKTGLARIRYIGFTGHKDPLVHLRMLEIAANHKFRFDAVQMPLNLMDAHFRSFEHQILPLLPKDEISVLGMRRWVIPSFSAATP